MSDDTTPGRSWDLENYKVGKNRPTAPIGGPKPGAADGLDHAWAQFGGQEPPAKLGVHYKADGTPVFVVALTMALLTMVTLGIYRFWMIARLRRHYWNAIRFQGDPLEYTGTGLEKLLGFLIAIMFLAVYLGIIQLLLTFVGLSYFDGNQLALQLSVLAALPFIFWATYRARRYLAARTRWRGIRFGMEDGAWGYTGRALLLSILTIATAGLAWPYQDFKLTKFMTDRTWFGDLKFEQDGSWLGLMSLWVWIYIAAGMMALVLWGAASGDNDMMTQFLAGLVIVFGYFFLLYLYLRYQFGAVRYLWDNRSLGDTRFENNLALDRTVWVYIGGSVAVGITTMVVAVLLFGVVFGAWALSAGDAEFAKMAEMLGGSETGAPPDLSEIVDGGWMVLSLVIIYLFIFAIAYALTQSFLVQPVLRRQVEATLVRNSTALLDAKQREADEATEAGGFADALGVDVGVGI